MAEVKLLKIGSTGLPTEMDSTNDEITLKSFTVTGGPKMDSTGIDFNGTEISDCGGIAMTAVDDLIAGIENQNLVDKTANEVITGNWDYSDGDIVLPDNQTASPVEGNIYWDGANDKIFVYDGAAWKDLSVSTETLAIERSYTANGNIAQYDAVYISANNAVSPAIADGTSKSYVIGFAPAAISDTETGDIREAGVIAGIIAGATAGTKYFLSDSSAGDITATPPSASGKDVVQVGVAKNATDLLIQIQYIGKRA